MSRIMKKLAMVFGNVRWCTYVEKGVTWFAVWRQFFGRSYLIEEFRIERSK
jgi:hypothetical protein